MLNIFKQSLSLGNYSFIYFPSTYRKTKLEFIRNRYFYLLFKYVSIYVYLFTFQVCLKYDYSKVKINIIKLSKIVLSIVASNN